MKINFIHQKHKKHVLSKLIPGDVFRFSRSDILSEESYNVVIGLDPKEKGKESTIWNICCGTIENGMSSAIKYKSEADATETAIGTFRHAKITITTKTIASIDSSYWWLFVWRLIDQKNERHNRKYREANIDIAFWRDSQALVNGQLPAALPFNLSGPLRGWKVAKKDAKKIWANQMVSLKNLWRRSP